MARSSILIVGGHGDIYPFMRETLQPHGYRVEGAETSLAALKKLAHKNYDLVIASNDTPDIDSLDLLERIRTTISTDIPTILVAETIQVEHAVRAVRLGVQDLLQKPVGAEALLRSVRKRLERAPQFETRLHDNLAEYRLTYEFRAPELVQEGLVDRLVSSFLQLSELPSQTASTLQLCLDEMMHNALLHGTLQMPQHQRHLDGPAYNELVQELLQNEEVRSRTVRVELLHDRTNRAVHVWVSDCGCGFDPQPFLQQDIMASYDSTGRGLRFLQVLCEDLSFENDGRTVYVKLGYEAS